MSQTTNSKFFSLLSSLSTRRNIENYLKLINQLGINGKMSACELAKILGVMRNSIYLYTHTLEKIGVIEKFPDRTDRIGRPAIYFRLTKKAIDVQ